MLGDLIRVYEHSVGGVKIEPDSLAVSNQEIKSNGHKLKYKVGEGQSNFLISDNKNLFSVFFFLVLKI